MRHSIKIATLVSFFSFCLPGYAENIKFPITQFLIQGNTLLPQEDLTQLTLPYTGDSRVYADIQKALEAVENAYRSAGYGAVQIHVPEQDISTGFVQMNVIETKLSNIVTDLNLAHFDRENVLASLPSLKKGQSPNTFAIANNVQLVNENPAKKVEVVMSLGEVAGEIDAQVKVKEEPPLSTTLSLDNSGNASTGQHRLGATVSHANIANRDQVLSASYITSIEKPEQVHIYSMAYNVPIFKWNDSVGLSVVHSDVSAGDTQTPTGTLGFSGKGMMVSAKYNMNLPRQGTYSQKFVFGIDHKHFDNNCSINGNAQACGSAGEDIQVMPLSLGYVGSIITPGLMADFGLNWISNQGGSGKEQFDKILPNRQASPNYNIQRINGNLLGVIGESDWQLRLAIQAQKSDSALISGEQIGLAGAYTLRSLGERALAADNGVAISAEIYTPELSDWLGANQGNLRLLGFVDTTAGDNNQTIGDSTKSLKASSVGVGARYNFNKDWVVRLDYGRLVDISANTASGLTPSLVNEQRNSDRVHASFMVKF